MPPAKPTACVGSGICSVYAPTELYALVNDTSVQRILLGSTYFHLPKELVINRDLVLEGDGAVLDARANPNDPRRVLSVGAGVNC